MTPVVTLAPLTADDADLLWAWAQDRELNAYTGAWPVPPSPVEMDGMVSAWLRSDEVRAFTIRVDDRIVGNCWLGHIDGTSASLGINIASPADRGRGYGTQAMRLLLDEVGDLRVTLWAYADNERALTVYRKVGFVETGRGERDGRETVEMAYVPSRMQ